MTYRQWVARERGGPEVLDLVTVPLPVPAAGQVRVRTLAAGVAFGDVLHRRSPSPGFRPPFVPGYDVVGVVDAVGSGVEAFRVGQTVASLILRGGYAEAAICPAEATVAVPDGVEPADAAAVVLNYLVAHQLLHRVTEVRPHQRILVHGAAGGVGTALLDLARRHRVEVVGTASTAKHDVIRGFGAQPLADTEFETRAAGVDAAFDPIGGTHWLRSYRCLRPGGRLAMFGAASLLDAGPLPTLTALAVVRLRAALSSRSAHWYQVVGRRTEQNPHLADDLSLLLGQLARGELQPQVTRVPFARAPQAQAELEARTTTGKIVLTVPG